MNIEQIQARLTEIDSELRNVTPDTYEENDLLLEQAELLELLMDDPDSDN